MLPKVVKNGKVTKSWQTLPNFVKKFNVAKYCQQVTKVDQKTKYCNKFSKVAKSLHLLANIVKSCQKLAT